MGLSPLTFTGISKFSDDFQTILSRSYSIATLPIQALQSDQRALLGQKSAISDLNASTARLAQALSDLADIGSGKGLAASSSGSAVTASLSAGAQPGAWQISEISSLASTAIVTSASGYALSDADQVSSGDHQLQLVVGGEVKTLVLGAQEDTLTGVCDAINAAGMGVSASIIDSGQQPQRYFLTISATTTGAKSIELRTTVDDPASNLMKVASSGRDARFQVNGQTVQRSGNFISGLIPGVDLQLNAKTGAGETITIETKPSRYTLQPGLQSFAAAYNDLVAKLDAQVGQNAGPLGGSAVVGDLQARLRALTGVSGQGSVRSLSDLGVVLASDGTMSVDTAKVSSMTEDALRSALQFLGSSTEGLGACSSQFSEFSDPLTGRIHAEIASFDGADQRLSAQIATLTERVNDMQKTTMAKLQAADALLAQLESQQGMLTATIESLDTITYGKRQG